MALKRRTYVAILLLLLVATAVAGVLSPVGQQRLLRPWLTSFLSQHLQGSVEIKRLQLQFDRAQVEGISIKLGKKRTVHIDQLEAQWRWETLRAGQLEGVDLDGWTLVWDTTTAPQRGTAPPQIRLPRIPVQHLELRQGTLNVELHDRQFTMTHIHGSLDQQAENALKLQAALGPQALLLSVEGALYPGEAPTLQLQQVRINDRPLLRRPFTLSLSNNDLPRLHLGLEALSSEDIRSVSRALALDPLLPDEVAFELVAPSLIIDQADGFQLNVELDAATVRHQNRTLEIAETKAEITRRGGWKIAGTVHLHEGTVIRGNARVEPQRWRMNAKATVPEISTLLTTLKIEGDYPVHGGLDLALQAEAQSGQPARATLHFTGREAIEKRTEQLSLAPLRGQVTTQLRPAGPELSAHIELDRQTRFSVNGRDHRWQWQFKAAAPLSLKALLPAGWWPQALNTLKGVRAKGNFHRDKERWQGEADWNVSSWRHAQTTVSDVQGHTELLIDQNDLSLPVITVNGQINAPGFTTAPFSLDAAFAQTEERQRVTLNHLHLPAVEFYSEDGLSAFSGGEVAVEGRLWRQAGQVWQWNVAGQAAMEEVLYGSLYAETGQTPLAFDARGKLTDGQRFSIEQGELQARDLATVTVEMDRRPGQTRIKAGIRLATLGGHAQRYLNNVLSSLRPETEPIKLTGHLTAQGDARLTDDEWSLTALVEPTELSIDWPAHAIAIANISGQIPLFFGDMKSDDRYQGSLSISGGSLGLLQIQTEQLPLEATANSLRLPAPIRLTFAEGTVELEGVTIGRLLATPRISSIIRVNRVSLSRLTADLGWPNMRGELTADLGRIHYQGQKLTSAGTAQIEAFGGKIILTKISAHNLLGPYPGVEMDVNFSGVDLKQVTQTFSFGEINGILDGQICNLRLLGRTPSHFDACFLSRPSGRRNISVKALRNLSVLSQGSIMGVLGRGLYRFIDFYRYRRIGARMALAKDSFRILGIARPSSQRYLVDGGLLPPKIDIIAPQSSISFKEMLRRLQRIDRQPQ